MGKEADIFHKRLASHLMKEETLIMIHYLTFRDPNPGIECDANPEIPGLEPPTYIRRKLRFSILRTTLMAVRGYKATPGSKDNENSDINTIPYSIYCKYLLIA